MYYKNSDFFKAFEALCACCGTLSSGASLDEDDELFRDALKRKCKEFLDYD